MRKRAPLVWLRGAWRVDLPTYQMIDGTFRTARPVPKLPAAFGDDVGKSLIDANGPLVLADKYPAQLLAAGPSVEVDLPDEWFNAKGEMIGAAGLRAMYADHARFGARGYEPPELLAAP